MRRRVEDAIAAELLGRRGRARADLTGSSTPTEGNVEKPPRNNPMTDEGDMITGGPGGVEERVPVGSEGDTIVLTDIGGGALRARYAAFAITAYYEAIQDMIGSFLTAGANISLSYNDLGNTLTIAVTGITSYPGDEAIQDMLSTFLVGGPGIDLTYSDVGNTLTITLGMNIKRATVAFASNVHTLDFQPASAWDLATNGSETEVNVVPHFGTGADEFAEGDHDHAHYIQFTIDGGGSAITVGTQIVIDITHSGTLTAWRGLADQSGSQVIDVWVDTYANYPPTNADSITNGHEPALSSATKAEDTDLSDWAAGRAVTAGQVMIVNVDSNTSITRITWRFTITPP